DNLRRHVEAFAEREAGAQAGPMAGGCVAADTRAGPLADVPAPSGAIARVIAHWPTLALRSVPAILSTRLARQRAIQALSGMPRGVADVQPGLFDRRAERARLAAAAAHADADAHRRRRLAALELGSAVSTSPPRLLLVLLP